MIWSVVALALFVADPASEQMSGPPMSSGQMRHDQVEADAKAGRLHYYPIKAQNAGGVSGQASINCAIDPKGWPEDCKLVEEKPTGYDFGVTALKMAPLFHFKRKPGAPPPDPDHPSRLTFPVKFQPGS